MRGDGPTAFQRTRIEAVFRNGSVTVVGAPERIP